MIARAIGAAVTPPVPAWSESATATATCGVVGRREGDEPRVVAAGDAGLGGPRLARDRNAGDLGGGAGARLAPPAPSWRSARLPWTGLIASFHSSGSKRWITLPSGATMRSTSFGSMTTPPFATPAATSAICSGVDDQALLAEREPAGVDLARARRVVEASVSVEAADQHLLGGKLDRRAARRSRTASRTRGRRRRRAPCRCCRRPS